jgi:hypothetical protein
MTVRLLIIGEKIGLVQRFYCLNVTMFVNPKHIEDTGHGRSCTSLGHPVIKINGVSQ